MNAVDVTVCTPTIAGREALLAEACRSVEAQSPPPAGGHLVDVDPHPTFRSATIAAVRNRLAARVATGWVACLDDDDRWMPHHLATVAERFADADAVCTFGLGPQPNVDITGWSRTRLLDALTEANILGPVAMVRTDVLWKVGGWAVGDFDPDTGRYRRTGVPWDDWDLWIRLVRAGARIVTIPTVTWLYRFGPHPHATDGRADHPLGVRAATSSRLVGEVRMPA